MGFALRSARLSGLTPTARRLSGLTPTARPAYRSLTLAALSLPLHHRELHRLGVRARSGYFAFEYAKWSTAGEFAGKG